MNTTIRTTTFIALVCCAMLAQAQSSAATSGQTAAAPSAGALVQRSDKPYPLAVSLPIDLSAAGSTDGKSASGGTAASTTPPVPVVRNWQILTSDITIANTLNRWARQAGWQVRWDAGKNVMVEAPDTITAHFEDAVRTVLESPGIATSGYPLEVCFYPNKPPLARVTRKGDQDESCK